MGKGVFKCTMRGQGLGGWRGGGQLRGFNDLETVSEKNYEHSESFFIHGKTLLEIYCFWGNIRLSHLSF